MRIAAFLLAALMLSFGVMSTYAAVAGDLITSLPGYGKTPTPQYSGFIAADAGETVFLHYWFVTASNNSATAPVVLWMNGGPGCSSLDGYLYEQGPLHFNGSYDANGLPLLADNPNAWTQIANVIFLEAPAGVGFSYAKNGSTTTNDEITSQNNFYFLVNFFKAYPEFASNEFFITGESYAGIYVPTLVDRVRLGNAAGISNINLVGFAVGNGCWGNAVGTCAQYGPFSTPNNGLEIQLDFLFGHGFYSMDTQDIIVASCGNLTNPNPGDACQNALDVATNAGGDYNIYDIYDDCPSPVSSQLRAPNAFYANRVTKGPSPAVVSDSSADIKLRRSKVSADPTGCIGSDYAITWLSNNTVQQALHVSNSPYTTWAVCAGIDYEKTVQSLLPLYPTLIAKYRTLIYSGDVDACVPYNGSEDWTRSLGYNVTDAWRPWTISDQVMGYVVTYAENGFSFLTVKGAGHMVPQYQPVAAFAMFQRFITNSGY